MRTVYQLHQHYDIVRRHRRERLEHAVRRSGSKGRLNDSVSRKNSQFSVNKLPYLKKVQDKTKVTINDH